MWKKLKNLVKRVNFLVAQTILSAIILAILIFIVVNFYIFSSIVNLNSFFYAFLLLSILTDGLFLLIHIPRRRRSRHKTYFNPKVLSVVIACHNGEDVIKETIENAAVHVDRRQIFVVSDASTDRTVEIAQSCNVNVIVNKKNLHKVGSINRAMRFITTPYVLLLDDDTLIGETFIPTSLLDDGYTAVAFNVMPVKEKTLINELQMFEYRATMQIAKNMRSRTGAIGNVSGAIGLYRTSDLKRQIAMHSGQFAGEDEQRTLLAHMYGEGKGIAYHDSLVLTKAPATYRELFRQRAFSWSIAAPELFVLYWRVLLSPKYHYLLKAEKAYLIYIFLTEPLRILFIWALFMKPSHLFLSYGFYFLLGMVIWFRLGRRDSLRSIIVMPIYSLGLTICRFIGYFYWLKVKGAYLVKKLHRQVPERRLLLEYAMVLAIIVSSWVVSIQHFSNDMHLLNKIRTETLTDNDNAFNYDSTSVAAGLTAAAPATEDRIPVFVEPGDSPRALAHKAVSKYLAENFGVPIDGEKRWVIDMWLVDRLPALELYPPNTVMPVSKDLVKQALEQTKEQPPKGVQL